MKKFSFLEDDAKKNDYIASIKITTKSGIILEAKTLLKNYGISFVKEDLSALDSEMDFDVLDIEEVLPTPVEKTFDQYKIGDVICYYGFVKDGLSQPVTITGVINNINTTIGDYFIVNVTEAPEGSIVQVGDIDTINYERIC